MMDLCCVRRKKRVKTMPKKICSPELSIVFPCLNEQAALSVCLEKAREACLAGKISFEIVVADNGSSDKSVELAHAASVRVIHVKEKGYGAALHQGILAAQGKYVAFCDADGSYPVGFFPQMLLDIKQNKLDLLLANRLKAPMQRGAMPWLNRYVGTPVLSGFIRCLFSYPVYDCNSGMRMLLREKYPDLDLHHTGMAYASEMLCAAAVKGWRYAECVMPEFKKDLRGRPPHLNRWRDGWAHLCVIWGLYFKTKLRKNK